MAQATGRTIEPGVGTGRNLRYYNFMEDPTLEVEAVDWSEKMIEQALSKGHTRGKFRFSV